MSDAGRRRGPGALALVAVVVMLTAGALWLQARRARSTRLAGEASAAGDGSSAMGPGAGAGGDVRGERGGKGAGSAKPRATGDGIEEAPRAGATLPAVPADRAFTRPPPGATRVRL